MGAGPLHQTHAPRTPRRLSERARIALWLGGWGALFAFLGLWGLGLNGAERAVDAWNERWTLRLERGEELFAAGRFEEAAAHLERVEAAHPAVFVKHRLDRQRERVLELLGESHLALGHARRALEAFERLVEFDPRNAHSHWLRARAARELGEDDLAREELEVTLAMHPTHLPALSARIALERERGRHAEAVAHFERYLDAWLLAPVSLHLGRDELRLELPVDGRVHTLEAPLALAAGWSGAPEISTGGYSFRLVELALTPPLRAGERERAGAAQRASGSWSALAADATGAGSFSARSVESGARLEGLTAPDGCARVRLELALYKSLPEDLWRDVRSSYESLARVEALAAAEARTLVGGCPEAGTHFED